jgi:hypothetical protein
MKKLAILVVAMSFAVVSTAQARENDPTITEFSTTSKKAGTSKKPVPTGLKFNYSIAEATGLRPIPVTKYSIRVGGMRVNTQPFARCTAAKINAAASSGVGNRDCPAGSIVGTGEIEAVIGNESDQASQGTFCFLTITIHNSGNNKAAIFLKGDPSGAPGRECAVDPNQAIDASFVRSSAGTALNFNVPAEPFRSYLGTLEVSVKRVQSTIKRLTKRVRGKTVGFFESVGGCVGGRRQIQVTMNDEEGKTNRISRNAACTK